MLKLLHKGDEDSRRFKILDAGYNRDAAYIPQLLARLESDETLHNKRHIVRALGLIGDPRAEDKLVELLESAKDLMLGDVAQSIGRLKCRKAMPRLKALLRHDVEWVRQNAKWALAELSDNNA